MNESKSVVGIEGIVAYTGRPWKIIKRWIDEEGFPAAKIDGRWESNAELIDLYRKRRLELKTGFENNLRSFRA